MLDGDMQYQLDQLYREELLQDAENDRLSQALPTNGKQAPYAPILALMGRTLSAMGDNLQERYGELQERAADSTDTDYQLETVK